MEDPRNGSPENIRNYPYSEIVGYFSIGEGRTFIPGSSKLKYFYPPPDSDFNLDEGRNHDSLDEIDRREDVSTEEKVPLMLKWIASNLDKVKAPADSDRLLRPHFVCPFEMLVRLLRPHGHRGDPWKIWAGKWQGTIYIKRDRSFGCRPQYGAGAKAPNFCTWGYKFQQYVSSELPNQAPDMTKPVELNEEFRCVYQYWLPKFSVLCSSTKKAVLSEEVLTDPIALDKLEFIDIRTKIITQSTSQNYERLMPKNQFLKWWAGAHLTNDDKVLCAFVDEEGIVKQLKTYRKNELVSNSMHSWTPDDCIDSCAHLLSFILEKVLDDCDQTVYAFTKIPGQEIIVTEESPTRENCVVPNWYKQALSQ